MSNEKTGVVDIPMKEKNELSDISIKHLSSGYNNTRAIEDICLEIPHGDYLGIIGPNGGGKTTLLKTILGLLPIIEGSVRIKGEPPNRGRRHIGYVPQYAQYDQKYPITAGDVVLMGRRNRRGMDMRYTPADHEAMRMALGYVDLKDEEHTSLSELSGGQRQRVYMARALAGEPSILLLDEPTANIDSTIEQNLYTLLNRLNVEKGLTILLITHDIGIISRHVKRIACLNRTLHLHDEPTITKEMLERTYQCPVDLIAHGVPHRVLGEHEGSGFRKHKGGE